MGEKWATQRNAQQLDNSIWKVNKQTPCEFHSSSIYLCPQTVHCSNTDIRKNSQFL